MSSGQVAALLHGDEVAGVEALEGEGEGEGGGVGGGEGGEVVVAEGEVTL